MIEHFVAKGLAWAIAEWALNAMECLALLQVILFDAPASGHDGSGLLVLYFWFATTTLLIQSVGIGLVLAGRYRAGGLCQIVASAPHALKLEGIIGLIGGWQAYHYRDADEAGAI